MSRESELVPNSWSDEDASSYIQKYTKQGEDIALRVYTSRLIGRDPNLVLHGGGNTSVKIVIKNIVGENKSVIAIKGSGWDMANIEPQGFPLVDLDHCKKLRNLSKLSDEEMVNQLRTHMEDFTSPTPSVETLLHAFLPHKFVDHSHADAILAIVDQPNAEKICRELYGDEYGIVPYIMPGFELSLLASNIYQSNTKVKGLILLKHGLFTFAETAKESYIAHIDAVNRAQRFIFAQPPKPLSFTRHKNCPHCTSDLACQLFPILRGIFHHKTKGTHWLLTYRPSQSVLEFCNSDQVEDWSHRGTLTPDHVIRTKAFPLVLKGFEDHLESESKIREFLVQKVESYIQEYHEYFSRQNEKSEIKKTELDPIPRVILIENLGLVTVGQTYSECTIAADIYEHTVSTIKDAMAVGSYDPVNESERFGMEYWSLEQAKLGKTQPPTLGARVVYITGAASGIGFACAEVFGKMGANLVLVDVNSGNLENAEKKLKSLKYPVHQVQADATKLEEVRESFKKAVLHFGGIDILISNAGVAFQSEIGQCTPQLFQQSLDINLIAHQHCASNAVSIMTQQKYGGCLLFNVSKAAVNPGKNFGPYAIAKAAEMALMKQYALEYAQYGIRSNAVNADRVRTNIFSEDVIAARAKARNLTPEEYFKSNLLQQEVTPQDVAQGFLFLAQATKTTAGTLTVDGGNLEASLR